MRKTKKLRKRCKMLEFQMQELELKQRLSELQSSQSGTRIGFCTHKNIKLKEARH